MGRRVVLSEGSNLKTEVVGGGVWVCVGRTRQRDPGVPDEGMTDGSKRVDERVPLGAPCVSLTEGGLSFIEGRKISAPVYFGP